MKASPFKIVEFENRTGTTSFRVTGMMDGKQVRKNFSNIEEAIGEKQRLETKLLNMPAPLRTTTRLTESQNEEAELAFSELKGFKLSLIDAVKWTKANYSDPEKKITVAKAFEKFISAKTEANRRPAYLRTLNQRVGLLAKTFPQSLVSDVQPDALKGLLFRGGSGLVNQESDYRAFQNFFNWAIKNEYCKTSPMAKIEPIELDEQDEPVILTLAQSRKLISAAAAYRGGVTLPYTVLGLFCAIRPTELERLTWENIDLEAQTVNIPGTIAKMRKRRDVAISDNALKFLLPFALRKPPLRGKNWRKDFDAVKKIAGFGSKAILKKNPSLGLWTPDVMRHTGITFHLSMNKDKAATALWAGNSPDVVHRSYKGDSVKPADCAAFWQIVPKVRAAKVRTKVRVAKFRPSDDSRKILKMG